ncbi:MAG: hypothetical protein AMXMBFR33_63780 [Candidatus Xenobia bacterium]
MRSLLLGFIFWRLLVVPVWGQPPSSPYDEYQGEEAIVVQPGGEYSTEQLDARKTGNPAYFSYMIRETNSEPWRVRGSERLVWRDTAVLATLNAFLILLLWRRRRT